MGRRVTRTLTALAAAAITLTTVLSGSAAAQTTGAEQFDGALVASGSSGKRKVVRSLIAAQGVLAGVGRIVERPNRPGDPDSVSRDDLVFPAGTLHIVNRTRKVSVKVNRRTCTVRLRALQTTTIDGGTGRFAQATGEFAATVSGAGVARRHADGTCDQRGAPLLEADTLTATGTLTF